MGLMNDQFGKNYQGGSSCPDTLQAFRNNQRSLSHEMLFRPFPSTRATVLVRVPRQGNERASFLIAIRLIFTTNTVYRGYRDRLIGESIQIVLDYVLYLRTELGRIRTRDRAGLQRRQRKGTYA